MDGGDLIAQSVVGGRYTIKSGWLESPCAISSVRVGRYLVLLPDAEGKAPLVAPDMVLEVEESTGEDGTVPGAVS